MATLPDKLHWKTGLCISLTQFSQAMQNGLPMTVGVFMVRKFLEQGSKGQAVDELSVGKLTGLLSAYYSFSQFLVAYPFGVLSDFIGRKPVVVFGNVASCGMVLGFGLAGSYTVAAVVRFVGGLGNGVIGAIKTIIGEGCSVQGQAQAMGYLSLAWGLGSIVGPMLGGVLGDPCRQWGPGVYLCEPGQLLYERPFFLPCLVVGTVSGIAAVCNTLMLPETLSRDRGGNRNQGRYQRISTDENQGAGCSTDSDSDVPVDVADGGRKGMFGMDRRTDCVVHGWTDRQNGEGDGGFEGEFGKGVGQYSAGEELELVPVTVTNKHPQTLHHTGSCEIEAVHITMSEDSNHDDNTATAFESELITPPPDAFFDLDADDTPAENTRLLPGNDTSSDRQHRADSQKGSWVPRWLHELTGGKQQPSEMQGDYSDVQQHSGPHTGDRQHKLARVLSRRVLSMMGLYTPAVNRRAAPGWSGPQGPGEEPPEGPGATVGPLPWYKYRMVQLCLLGYSSICFLHRFSDESVPLFAAAPHDEGGLDWAAEQLAPSISFGGLILMLFALAGYPRLQRRWGVIFCARLGLFLTGPLMMFYPLAGLITARWLQQLFFFLATGSRAVVGTLAFTSSIVMVNLSSPKDQMGTVNGIGQTAAALVRGLAPALAGVCWSVTLQVLSMPLLRPFVAYILVGICAILTQFVYHFVVLPESKEALGANRAT